MITNISYIELDLKENQDEIPINYEELDDNDDWLDPNWLESLDTDLPTSTEAQAKKSQDLIIVSSEVRKDPSCVDQKVWCKFADCSLENVRRNCQKTCNKCL